MSRHRISQDKVNRFLEVNTTLSARSGLKRHPKTLWADWLEAAINAAGGYITTDPKERKGPNSIPRIFERLAPVDITSDSITSLMRQMQEDGKLIMDVASNRRTVSVMTDPASTPIPSTSAYSLLFSFLHHSQVQEEHTPEEPIPPVQPVENSHQTADIDYDALAASLLQVVLQHESEATELKLRIQHMADEYSKLQHNYNVALARIEELSGTRQRVGVGRSLGEALKPEQRELLDKLSKELRS